LLKNNKNDKAGKLLTEIISKGVLIE
jgi:hypothetical protein